MGRVLLTETTSDSMLSERMDSASVAVLGLAVIRIILPSRERMEVKEAVPQLLGLFVLTLSPAQ